jgi:signal transduction histidine kinase
LAQLGSGLAHEMRNPLHALRINLHTLKRAIGQCLQTGPGLANGTGGKAGPQLSHDQLTATVSESDAVIDRLDVLLRDLVQLTAPTQGERASLNIASETKATLSLLAEDLRRSQVEVRTDWPAVPIRVNAEPGCLRQVLLNLLTFAQHGAGKNGVVEVRVQSQDDMAEVAVASSGLTLSDEQRARLFDPFQSPVETGSGLGLALVQSILSNLGGTASGQRRAEGGTILRIRLPLAPAPDAGVSS